MSKWGFGQAKWRSSIWLPFKPTQTRTPNPRFSIGFKQQNKELPPKNGEPPDWSLNATPNGSHSHIGNLSLACGSQGKLEVHIFVTTLAEPKFNGFRVAIKARVRWARDSPSLSHSRVLSLSLSLSLSPSLSLSLSLSSLSLSLSRFFFFFFLSLSLARSLSLSLSLSLSSLSLSLSRFFFFFFLSLSLARSLSFSLSFSLSRFHWPGSPLHLGVRRVAMSNQGTQRIR